MQSWILGRTFGNHFDTFYFDETDDGLLRVLVTTESHVPMEIGDIIFSEETAEYRNILEFRLGPSYFSQSKINNNTQPLTDADKERHKKLFNQALPVHPAGDILLKIYNWLLPSNEYYKYLQSKGEV